MKMIKTYESFFKNLFKKQKEATALEIKEAFVELCDNNYEVTVVKYTPKNELIFSVNCFTVKIEKIHPNHEPIEKTTFKISDIKPQLDFALSYLKEEFDLKINKIRYDKLIYVHPLGLGPRPCISEESIEKLKNLNTDNRLKKLIIYFK